MIQTSLGLVAGSFRRTLTVRAASEGWEPSARQSPNSDDRAATFEMARALVLVNVSRFSKAIEPSNLRLFFDATNFFTDLTEDLTEDLDLVIGVNCYYPEHFLGRDVTGWRDQSWGIMRASGQLRSAVHLELAREQVRLLGPRLRMLHPVPHTEVRGTKFYESFLDRSRWPQYMRHGYRAAHALLRSYADGVRSKRARRESNPRPTA